MNTTAQTLATPPATVKVANMPNFRLNSPQLVDFFGHGLYNVKYLGKCPVSGIRMYEMPGSPYPGHDYTDLAAAEYGMTGPDFRIAYLASNDSAMYHRALAMAQKTWFPSPATVGPVTAVQVNAVTYFDKANGNPYFRATAYCNDIKVLEMPRQYDNPNNIQHTALAALEKAGFIEVIHGVNGREMPDTWATRNGATFNVRHHAVSHKEFYQLGEYAN